ncbi:MAG: ATP-dependent helicase [Luteibaculaceae bacterium]
MEYLKSLNPSQRDAVECTEGPVMVIAGAGSGKTRVLTYRIAHIINKGIDPFNILALTFTNKAAKEMKERIGKIIGVSEAKNIWMGTFHSVFAKILRIEHDKINYPQNFTIYDTADSKNLIKSIIKEMGLNPDIYKHGNVLNRISSAKNNLISPQAYKRNPEIMITDQASGKEKIADIYLEYNQRLFRAGAMDFDDLLFNTNVLLKDFPDVLHKYQNKFKYILVDEYQDTNFSQYLIVKNLAAKLENLCVVGDDAQSIYAFRGANIQNILNFRKDYPDFKQYKLEENYRSTKNIVEAANTVIKHNKDQIKKTVFTNNTTGEKILVHKCLTDNDEGAFVASKVFDFMHQHNANPKDFAVLYRTNSQSRAIEEGLRRQNIPYRIYGGLSFYQRKEIKDLLAYFRLVANPNDEEALKRIINYPTRGIGNTTLDRLIVAANENSTSIWDIACNLGKYNNPITGAAASKVSDFVVMIKSFRTGINTDDAYDLAENIAKQSRIIAELYLDKSPEGVSRYENIQELLSGIKTFSEQYADEGKTATLPDFLVDVALLTDADQDDNSEDKVTLMTIHASKGLEFKHLFIVGLEENLFPSQMALNSRSELEEERRLFYVAITRAMENLTLSYANTRFRWGSIYPCEPSRFLEEIDSQYLEYSAAIEKPSKNVGYQGGDNWGGGWGSEQPIRTEPREKSYTAAREKPKPFTKPESTPINPGKNMKRVLPSNAPTGAQSDLDLEEGNEVMHEKFGKGKVLKIEGESPNVKATVFFPSEGSKTLLLRFAKLTKL